MASNDGITVEGSVSGNTSMIGTHWGHYRVTSEAGRVTEVAGSLPDGDPSEIGQSLLDAMDPGCRIARPAIRQSYLNGAPNHERMRGREPFVEVSWDQALELTSRALADTIKRHGNSAIYGGSYGWASAGRFHHAQSQIHRFLNTLGGYTASVNTYSGAASEVIIKRVLGTDYGTTMDGLIDHDDIARHTDLHLAFGGVCLHNNQVVPGGVGAHRDRDCLLQAAKAGVEMVNIGPNQDDMPAFTKARWLPVRPSSDAALLLALAHAIETRGRVDRAFLASHSVGYEHFRSYLLGETDGTVKDLEWAAPLCDIAVSELEWLADRLIKARRPLITLSLAIQRAEHGEQPYWLGVTLAAMLGVLGLPGGGVGLGWGNNGRGVYNRRGVPFKWGTFPQGRNPIDTAIPVARIVEMLENPGGAYDYDGDARHYPDIKLIYWAGGNPFHHHQDLNRLRAAWCKPDTIIVNENVWTATARHADIVLPVISQLERNDIACGRDNYILASKQAVPSYEDARSDYAIFSDLAERLGQGEAFTEGRDEMDWLRVIYEASHHNAAAAGIALPDFDSFWHQNGPLCLEDQIEPNTFFIEQFREDPTAHPLATPSGKVEIFSDTIASFDYANCPGHPVWLDKQEWLGAEQSKRFPLHLLSPQPRNKLHSQLDFGRHSKADKIDEREVVRLNPTDASKRGIKEGTLVRLYNDRGACLAIAKISEGLMPGVLTLPTGAWFDPDDKLDLDRHGNPNALTLDIGTSSLAQGTSAQSCLVEIEPYLEPAPEVMSFSPPLAAAE
jgi:biotin/methionine sulfoxide reductase